LNRYKITKNKQGEKSPQPGDKQMNKYLIALPGFRVQKGFCYQTILIKAKDEADAIDLVFHFKGRVNIGEIKQIN